MDTFRMITEWIVWILCAIIIILPIFWRKEYFLPAQKNELRQPKLVWPASALAGLVFSCCVSFEIRDSGAVFCVIAILIMLAWLISALWGINWRIVYNDTEFFHRDAFRGLSKYAYDEIVELKYNGELSGKAGSESAFTLVMPDKKISIGSTVNPGSFFKLCLKKVKNILSALDDSV